MPQNIIAVFPEREQGRRWAREREKLRVSENALQRTSDGSMQTVAFWVPDVITLPYLGAGVFAAHHHRLAVRPCRVSLMPI